MLTFYMVNSVEEVERDTPYIGLNEETFQNIRFMREYGKLENGLEIIADLDEYADTKLEKQELEEVIEAIDNTDMEEILPTVSMFLKKLREFSVESIEKEKALMAIGD